MNVLRLYAVAIIYLTLIMLSGCITLQAGMPKNVHDRDPTISTRDFNAF